MDAADKLLRGRRFSRGDSGDSAGVSGHEEYPESAVTEGRLSTGDVCFGCLELFTGGSTVEVRGVSAIEARNASPDVRYVGTVEYRCC